MPKKVTLEDGNEIEILTEEEVNELKEKAKKVDELSKSIEELKADDGNRNWSAMRKTLEAQRKALKEKGIEMDDDGNVKELSKNFSQEEVQKMIEDNTNKALLKQHINLSLKNLDENKRKVVLSNYDKLTAGEEISIDNVDNFISSAMSASGIQGTSGSLRQAISGSTPFSRDITSSGGGEKGFSETEEGKALASNLGLELNESK